MLLFSNGPEHALMDSVVPALDAFAELDAIENAFNSVLSLSESKRPITYDMSVSERLICSVHAVGFASLADGIIERNRRSGLGPIPTDGTLKQALRRHVLQPRDRFSVSSRNMRRFIKTICMNASEETVHKIESVWREIITDMVFEKCTQTGNSSNHNSYNISGGIATKLDFSPPSLAHINGNNSRHTTSNNSNYSNPNNPEARSEGLVDFLIASLEEIRSISKMDLAATEQCCMSTDLAFVAAFKRMPKEKALELTKALVVRISSLVDSYKTQSMSRSWAQALEGITDLIQV